MVQHEWPWGRFVGPILAHNPYVWHAAHSELVHIHIHLCDVGQANDVRNKADDCNEDLSTLSKDMGEFINQGSDEAFHSAELERLQNQVETVLHNTFLSQ